MDNQDYDDYAAGEEVRRLVHEAADQIVDPCAMGFGVRIGMAEMGLVVGVEPKVSADGWRAEVHLRVTEPGCMYIPYFEQQLREKLQGTSVELSIEWDSPVTWTPEDMSADARQRLKMRFGGMDGTP